LNSFSFARADVGERANVEITAPKVNVLRLKGMKE